MTLRIAASFLTVFLLAASHVSSQETLPDGTKAATAAIASFRAPDDLKVKLFAAEPLSKQRGYTAGTFSFNSGTGRCPTCAGSGFEHVGGARVTQDVGLEPGSPDPRRTPVALEHPPESLAGHRLPA